MAEMMNIMLASADPVKFRQHRRFETSMMPMQVAVLMPKHFLACASASGAPRDLRAAYREVDICDSEIDSKAVEFCGRTFAWRPRLSRGYSAALNFGRKFALI
jgi:hypothetical protein